MNAKLRALAAQQGGAFTVVQARRCGIERWHLAAMLKAGTVTRLRRGGHAETSTVQAEDGGAPSRGRRDIGGATQDICESQFCAAPARGAAEGGSNCGSSHHRAGSERCLR